MCLCWSLFVPTQFHFECCGVCDDSWWHGCVWMYIYKRCLQKDMKPWWKVKGFFNRASWKVSDVWIVRYTWVLSSFSLSLCLSLSLCVVCCVLLWCSWLWLCWWWMEERRWGGEGERLIEPSGPKFPSRLLKLNSLFRKSESLEESGTCCSQSILKLENGKDPKVSLVNLWSPW